MDGGAVLGGRGSDQRQAPGDQRRVSADNNLPTAGLAQTALNHPGPISPLLSVSIMSRGVFIAGRSPPPRAPLSLVPLPQSPSANERQSGGGLWHFCCRHLPLTNAGLLSAGIRPLHAAAAADRPRPRPHRPRPHSLDGNFSSERPGALVVLLGQRGGRRGSLIGTVYMRHHCGSSTVNPWAVWGGGAWL